MRKVIEGVQFRRQINEPVNFLCRFSEAVQTITEANVRFTLNLWFVVPRVAVRSLWGC